MDNLKFWKHEDSMNIKKLILSLIVIVLTSACNKKDLERVVKIATGNVNAITETTAVAHGSILDLGAGISDHGFCWAETPQPDVDDSVLSLGVAQETSLFSKTITGLKKETKYYVRAYATNGNEIVYGNEVSFTTNSTNPCAGETTVTFYGYSYELVEIGSQCWFAQNLRNTRYANGDSIRYETNDTNWAALNVGAYCWYGNDSSAYENLYGKLYNWLAVGDSRNICPDGYHIPTDEEWKTLEMSLGMSQEQADTTGWRGNNEGSELKSILGWQTTSGTNSSGFTTLPGGYRDHQTGFNGVGNTGYFWTADTANPDFAWMRYMASDKATVFRNYNDKQFGFSCRCVKD